MTDVFPIPTEFHSPRPTGQDWKRLQQTAASRVPELALRRGGVVVGFAPLGYRIVVEGEKIHPALSPPYATVGGVTVVELQYAADGRVLRGRLPHRPPSTHFVLDYGFARVELTLAKRTAWWFWIRPLLLQIWTWIDKMVRTGFSLLP
jgi:hypothetical protein